MKKILFLIFSIFLASCADYSSVKYSSYPTANEISANYYNCKAGTFSCKKHLLTEAQLQVVEDNESQRKLTHSKTHLHSGAPSYVGTCSESGSCYGDLSKITGSPKTTYVHGYYRKNGTYVRSHYRSRRH